MDMLRARADKPEKDLVSRVASELRKGSIIIYPTDTVYGIGCSIKALDSVKRIYDIKERKYNKPLSVAFSSLDEAKKYVIIGPAEEEYVKKHLKEPYTYVVLRKEDIPDIVTGGLKTVGIRIMNHELMKEVLIAADVPIITTSANLSGGKSPASVEEIDKELLDKADLVLDAGPCRTGVPSTVLELAGRKVLRQG
jgi:L-threonylcarbamoyladenylate synthase